MPSLHEAFGVESPNADTKQIPLEAACPVGELDTTPNPTFQFEYRPLRRALRNIARQHPIWCWGPSGCGKTEYFIQIAARLKRPCHVISFGEESSLRELLGSFELVSNEAGTGFETRYRYGQLVKALQAPGAIVVLDEFNMAPAAVAAQLNRMLEVRSVTIPETGESIEAAENVTFVVTANTSGASDEVGIYAGSQVQNGATRARFAGLRMHYLPPEKEEAIINTVYPKLNAAVQFPDSVQAPSTLMVQCGNMIRSLVDDGSVSLPFTVRQIKHWAGATLDLRSVGDAFADAYYDLLSADERTAVGEVYHKVFGTRLEH